MKYAGVDRKRGIEGNAVLLAERLNRVIALLSLFLCL